jgi:hypothetical protein
VPHEPRSYLPHHQPEIDPGFQRAAWVLWGVVFLMAASSCLLIGHGCSMITGIGFGPSSTPIARDTGVREVSDWMNQTGYHGQFEYVEGSVEQAPKDSSIWHHLRLNTPRDVSLLYDATVKRWGRGVRKDPDPDGHRAAAPDWWPRPDAGPEHLVIDKNGNPRWRLVLDYTAGEVYLENIGQ